jgi:hypothetical protein
MNHRIINAKLFVAAAFLLLAVGAIIGYPLAYLIGAILLGIKYS